MDRRFSYIGANPDIKDILLNSRFALEALAKLSEAVLGSATVVDGFNCVPTAPASLTVTVGPGQIYQQAPLEASPISSLDQDTHTVTKQGLLRDAVGLTLAPPSTTGQAVNVLIQAQYTDDDTSDRVVYNYYDPSNPDVPLTGPGGNNQAQTATRKGVAQVATKYGVPATSGSQVSPNPDAGWAPLFVVTLTFGQSAITAGNIVRAPNAPFIGIKLPDIPEFIRAGRVPRISLNPILYVRADGNDANDGSENTAGKAFATIAAALARGTDQYTFAGSSLTIQLGIPGRYTSPLVVPRAPGAIRIVGDQAAQASYVIVGAGSAGRGVLEASSPTEIIGLTIENSGSVAHTFAATSSARVLCFSTTFLSTQPIDGFQVFAPGGVITLASGCRIQGSALSAIYATGGGEISVNVNTNLQIVGSPTFSLATIAATQAGRIILLGGASVSGAATGRRYLANTYGIITTNGGGPNAFPGTTPGTVDNAIYQ